MKVINVPTSQVIPYARNPRRNANAVAGVAASLKEFGFCQPIVVDENMVIIAGHTRLLAAQELGLLVVPVVIAKGLTPHQVKAYRLADNRVAQNSTWDNELLVREILELAGDYTGTGFSEKEIANLLREESGTVGSSDTEPEYKRKFEIVVNCEDEADQQFVYHMLIAKGYVCRVLSM